jgi:hypothetical protein
LIPIKTNGAVETAQALVDDIFPQSGRPVMFLSDRNPTVKSKLLTELYLLFGVARVRTSAYDPKGRGLLGRVLKSALRALTNRKRADWDLWSSPVESVHDTHPANYLGGVDTVLSVNELRARTVWDCVYAPLDRDAELLFEDVAAVVTRMTGSGSYEPRVLETDEVAC